MPCNKFFLIIYLIISPSVLLIIIHPNLLFIVNKSKNIEEIEIKAPATINGFDFELFIFSELFLVRVTELLEFFLLSSFEKGLITIKYS